MTYRVTSERFAWQSGTVLTEAMLVGCNIEAAIAGGHLVRVVDSKPTRSARTPVRAKEQ
jgi:hypothetical protein